MEYQAPEREFIGQIAIEPLPNEEEIYHVDEARISHLLTDLEFNLYKPWRTLIRFYLVPLYTLNHHGQLSDEDDQHCDNSRFDLPVSPSPTSPSSRQRQHQPLDSAT